MTHLGDRTDCRAAISFETGWGGDSPNYPGAPNVIKNFYGEELHYQLTEDTKLVALKMER